MIDKKQKITIYLVATKAGYSASYIYKYSELSYKIQTLREQQKYILVKADKTNLDADNCLKALSPKNVELAQKIEKLKDYHKPY